MSAQGTAILYQGALGANGSPANGNFDIVLALYNDPQIGSQQGLAVTNYQVGVTNGLFTTSADFGATPWTGQQLWMQLLVRTSGNGSFTTLSPRQPLLSTPYSIQALSASSATSAASANNFTGRLTGDVTGTQGATTVSSVGGQSAANVASGVVAANNANSANTANALVARDSSGNFSAGTITANLNGNAASATTAASFSGSLAGDVTGSANNTKVGFVGGVSAANIAAAANLIDGVFSTAGYEDVFVGQNAGNPATQGMENTAIGYQAFFENTSGYFDTASGYDALLYNTNGNYNTATGARALYMNQNGNDNTATGMGALSSSQSGAYNTATGALALSESAGGTNNTATGAAALAQAGNALNNTATGAYSLQYLGSGSNNVAEGAYALGSSASGNNNTAIGAQALAGVFTGSGNIALGTSAGSALDSSGTSNIDIGNTGSYSDNNIIRIGTPGVHTATYLAGTLNGDGGGLTNLSATELTGTVPFSQLPAAIITNESTNSVTLNGNLDVSNLTVNGSLTVSNSPGITFDESVNDFDALPTTWTNIASTTNSAPGNGYFFITGSMVESGVGDGDTIYLRLWDDTTGVNLFEEFQTGAATSTFGGNSSFNTLNISYVLPIAIPGQKHVILLQAQSTSSSGEIYYHTLTVLYVPRLNN